jgi:hypothetical protein
MSAARRWHVLVRLALACPALVLVGAAKASAAYAASAKPAPAAEIQRAQLRRAAPRLSARSFRRVTRDAKLQSRRASRISARENGFIAPLYLFHCALLI